MGSGTSRGKKVAPARVSEANATNTAVGVTSSKQGRRPFKPLKVGATVRKARNRAQPDCHSDGHDSDFSREDDEIDGGVDTFLTDCEDRERSTVKTSHPKKTATRSKTYGLCHFGQGEEEEEEEEKGEEVSSAPRMRTEEASGTLGAPKDVTERSRDAFTPDGFLTSGTLLEVVPATEKKSTFGSSSLPMPMYDGSDEELMDTIEKEFS